MAILITGGARSGKSDFAEAAAARLADRGVYVATLEPLDEEMQERMALHRQQRAASGFDWRTIEEPHALTARLRELAADAAPNPRPPVVLVDCLTLWLTNRMLALEGENGAWGAAEAAALAAEMEQLVELCGSYPLPLLLVTNEVGGGLVPEYSLGRRFRDEAGRLNRRLAAVCERVYLVTAGIPVELKSIAVRLDEL